MNQYVFIVGLSTDSIDPVTKVVKTAEENYQGFQNYLQTYWPGHMGIAQSQFFTSRWNRDVVAEIQAKYPTGNLRIMAHSFGGQKAIEVTTALIALGRTVEQLILFDPVNYNNPNVINTQGFRVPVGVARCRCWHRSAPSGQAYAMASPYSAGLALAYQDSQWVDTVYVPKTTDPHGECVWFPEAITEAKLTILVPPAPIKITPTLPPPTPSPIGHFGSPFFVAIKYLTLIQDHEDAGVVNWDEAAVVNASELLNTIAHQLKDEYLALPPVKEI